MHPLQIIIGQTQQQLTSQEEIWCVSVRPHLPMAGKVQPPQQVLATAAVLLAEISKPLCNQQQLVMQERLLPNHIQTLQKQVKRHGAVRLLPKSEVAEPSRQAQEQS